MEEIENNYPKVLVVDESRSIRESLSTIFKREYGITGLPVTHQELLTLFLQNPKDYSAIIMSLVGVMPEDFSRDEIREADNGQHTGYVIINRIRNGQDDQNPGIPILLYTGMPLEKKIDENTCYLTKPLLPKDLFKKLMDMWGERGHMGILPDEDIFSDDK